MRFGYSNQAHNRHVECHDDASVGDDVFGEDPTVNLLESRMAGLFGMESALFCASGTMSNQAAIVSHTRPGDELICEQEAHVYIYEGGGIAFNAGCQVRPLAGDRGRILATQVIQSINADDVHKARTSVVCLENTSNRGRGSCYDLAEMIKIKKSATLPGSYFTWMAPVCLMHLLQKMKNRGTTELCSTAYPFVLIKDSDARPAACSWVVLRLYAGREGCERYLEEACARQDTWRPRRFTHWIIILKDWLPITNMPD